MYDLAETIIGNACAKGRRYIGVLREEIVDLERRDLMATA